MQPLLALARRYGLKVLEDAAQVFGGTYHGARAGGIGDAAAFSFYPTKNLGAFGDGGLITTNDDYVAERVRMLRGHGSKGRELNSIVGYNSRLDEIQAAILRVKLPHVDKMIAARRAHAARYDAAFAEFEDVVAPPVADGVFHVYHQYTVRVRGGMRDAVRQRLTDARVGTMIYYGVPVHRLPVYAEGAPALPVAEGAAHEVLSLPIWPTLSESGQRRCIAALAQHLAELQRQ
jgi:dTDP-4-amino-4,6-dideoxygalactose transaminase